MLKKISTIFTKGKTDSLRNRLIRGAVGSFGLKIAGTGLTLVVSILLARLLGTEGFGVYAYAISWSSLLSIPATLGLDKLIIREVAIYRNQSNWGLMRGLLDWSNQLVLLFSINLALIATGVAWSLNINTNSQMLLAFYVALVYLPIGSLRSLRLAAMKGLHQVVLGQVPEVLIAPLLMICFTGCGYLFLGKELNAIWVIAIFVASTTITFFIGARLLQKVLPLALEEAEAEYQTLTWIHSALPLMFLSGMQIINTRTDTLMLGAMKGPEAVGIYIVINRGVQLIVFMQGAVNGILAPTIASLYAEGKIKQLQKIVTKSARVVLLTSLIFASSLTVFGYWFLLLFGLNFTQGQTALTILSIGQLINAASGAVGLLLTMTGHQNYTVLSVGISAILNVLLNVLLIPEWGVNGAALATASSMIFWNVFSLIWVRTKLGIDSTALGNIK
jgi:O-antigen/teichoic acid export membrane protein